MFTWSNKIAVSIKDMNIIIKKPILNLIAMSSNPCTPRAAGYR